VLAFFVGYHRITGRRFEINARSVHKNSSSGNPEKYTVIKVVLMI
jgi:hypothetical protein